MSAASRSSSSSLPPMSARMPTFESKSAEATVPLSSKPSSSCKPLEDMPAREWLRAASSNSGNCNGTSRCMVG
eukprot:5604862-Lingulodinium_polyedra.AAC.1